MKTENVKILIIDDEKQIRKFLRVFLQAHEYTILEADNGQAGIEMVAVEKPDLIILDLGLPDMDGFEVLTKLREWSKIPVIILSVREAENEKVKLLDAGANDYVTKPFNTGELMARIRVALRHAYTQEGKNPVLTFGHMRIDFPHHAVYVDNKKIDLTKKEYEIVRLLASDAGKIVTHEHLLKTVWGEIYKDHVEYLRTYVAQIRRKIEKDPTQPELIITEAGLGYRFREPD